MTMAECIGCKLGPIVSLSESRFTSATYRTKPSWQHRTPFLEEIHYGKGLWEEVSLGPHEVDFVRSVDVSYAIESS